MSRYKFPGLSALVDINSPIIPGGSFTWAEATKMGTRIPHHADITTGIILLAKALQPFRDDLGLPIKITSWYRPPDVNRAAGGVSNSLHLTGKGLDCYTETLSASQLYAFFSDNWRGGLGLYSGHIHLDVGPYSRF